MVKRNIKGNIFLYRRAQEHLEKLVRQGVLKADERIPGERVLSKSLDVSRDTIRTALHALEAEGFLVRIPAKGTFIRRTENSGGVNIAFVFPEPEISLVYQVYDNYTTNAELWRGIVAGGAENGVTVSFLAARANADGEAAQNLADRLMRSFDGVILPSDEFAATAKILGDAGFPCIHCCQSRNGSFVYYNRSEAVAMAANCLLANGCQKVLLLGKVNGESSSWDEKTSVFRREFAANDLNIPDENIVTLCSSHEETFSFLNEYFDRHPELPDAIFCASPAISLALLHIARERNWQIPAQLQVCSYANHPDHQTAIQEITHIRLPHAEIGRKAVKVLVDKIRNGSPIPEKTLLSAQLVQGETTTRIYEAKISN